MSQANVEIVRRIYEGVSERLEPPRELFEPGCEFDDSDVPLDSVGVLRGYDDIVHNLLPYWETFEDFRVEVEEVIHASEKQVITRVRDGGRLKGSESEVWNRFFHVWTLAGGKVARLSVHTDSSRALEAAGLPGQEAPPGS
jgi:ketosteroid isomerase-like protein